MNEQIKKLLEDADMGCLFRNGEMLPGMVNPDSLKKFAQLMVQECAETVEVYIHESLYNGLYERGYNDGRNASALLIKQHFGVEE